MSFMVLLAVGVILWGASDSFAVVGNGEAVPAFDQVTVNGSANATVAVKGFGVARIGLVATPLEAAVGDSVIAANKYTTSTTGRDSVGLAGTIDSIKLEVSPKGIIGIRGRNAGGASSLDSAFAAWYPKTAGNADTTRASVGTGDGDSVSAITLKSTYRTATGALDSLEIYPLGLRNGTVTITAKSRKSGRTIGTITVNVTDQRPTVAVSTITAVPTREPIEGATPARDTAGVRLRWTHPATGGPSTYEILAFSDSVGISEDSIGDIRNGAVKRTTYAEDTLGPGFAVSSTRKVTVTGTSRTAILDNLEPDSVTYILIRGIGYGAANDTAGRLLGTAKAGWGGSSIVKIKALKTKSVNANASSVSYPTVGGKVYNGTAQDIGRATLSPGITDRTYSGLDPWDTTYVFASTPLAKANPALNAARLNDTALWKDVKKPVDAGLCTTTVIFENKSTKWSKTTVFNIAPRQLADGFIVSTPGNPTFPYTGLRVEPVNYVVTDNLSGLPADRKSLEIAKDYIGVGVGDSTADSTTVINDIDVGAASATNGPKIRIKGYGNYAGFATKGFAITPKPVAVDVDASDVANLIYNGTKFVDSANVSVVFKTVGYDQKSLAAKDVTKFTSGVDSAFVFTATLASGDVSSTGVKATVQVSLGKGSVAKNYTLSAADGKFEKTVTISQKSVLDSSDFKIPGDTIPTNHLYNGQTRGIGVVGFGYAQPANTASITVLYDGDTAKPVDVGQYQVTAVIDQLPGKTSNYVDGSSYSLGTYEIGTPLSAVVDSSNLGAASVRSKSTFALWVAARSPNGGTVSYRWYKNDVLIPGATGARYTPNIDTVGSTAEYYVKLINAVPNVQVPDTIDSEKAAISVIEAAKTLKDLTVVAIEDSLIYNGTAQVPSSITVAYAGEVLSETTDYTLSFANNVNAGSGFVYIIGQDAYKDTILVNFPIARRKLVREDFFVNLNRTYNAAPQVLTATVTADPTTSALRERLGTPTFTYNGSTTAPTNAGKYGVRVTFVQGTNFTASDSAFVLDSLVIARKAAIASDFDYTIPTGHVYTGQTQGIGSVAIKGSGSGKLTVLYDYDAALPVAAGTYTVAVEVEGGDNYTQGIALLGQYKIATEAELVSDAKIAVESSGYGPATQDEANTQAAAVVFINSALEELELAGGVTATILPGLFTAPVAGTDDLPIGTNGVFSFRVVLEKGAAKDTTILLSLNIIARPVSVAGIDRVIPGGKDEQAVVAPVAVIAGEFTVGPNPVAKTAGKAGFFWQGKAVASGTLYVFSTSGNVVAKVKVADKGISTDRREIGSWNLGSVAEGTYLVKGVLVGKDGGKVKVSSLVGVR